MSERIRVAVLYGGTSAEHEVSVVSARSVLTAIDRSRYDVVPVAITKEGQWLLPAVPPDQLPEPSGALPSVSGDDGTAVALRRESGQRGALDVGGPIDVVFPVLHGPGGEDGAIQGLLSVLGIPTVGSGVSASAVGMNKVLQKAVFANAGIPVAPWIDVRFHEFSQDVPGAVLAVREFIGLPCFTKPANMGSSIGVAKCKTAGELLMGLSATFQHDRLAIVEKAIDGRELECGVLGNDGAEASVVGEVIPSHEFYDYESKYLDGASKTVVPADIPSAVAEQVRDYALRAFHAIGCDGMARVDFFLDTAGHVWINEINTIPGFTPISMYPKLWEASGVGYTELIDRLIALALGRAP